MQICHQTKWGDADSTITATHQETDNFQSPQDLLAAPMAPLTRRAETIEAWSFLDAAVKLLEAHEAITGARQRKRTKAAQTGFPRAAEAFMGDLLLGAKMDRGGWVFRTRHAKSFSGGEVTYRRSWLSRRRWRHSG